MTRKLHRHRVWLPAMLLFFNLEVGCYLAVSGHLLSWQEAENYCQTLGNNVHLARPDTPEVIVRYSRFTYPLPPLTFLMFMLMSAGVAPIVNLKECRTYMPPPNASKAVQSGFETQRRHHQKSKTGVSVVPQKELMSSKHFFKKQNIFIILEKS